MQRNCFTARPLVLPLVTWVLCGCLWHAPTVAQVTIDTRCLKEAPPGVRIGAEVTAVSVGDLAGLQFHREGIVVATAGVLSAEGGTVKARFQLPSSWPSADRATLMHVGEQAHEHVTLFAQAGRITAVYKAGENEYAAIQFREAANWASESWHELAFSWQADERQIRFYLAADGRLVGIQTGRLIEQWPDRAYVGVRRQGQTWQGLVHSVTLSPECETPRELQSGRRTVVVHASKPRGTCYDFWSINNFTSQHMFLDAQAVAQLRRDKPFMRSVNCVRLLGGRHDEKNAWYLGVDEQGQPRCDFRDMIRYLRGMQDAGYTPRIVLDNIPTAMSDSGELAMYGNTRPARDLRLWHAYVTQAVQAMVDAFGSQTVAGWRFRVGTEPDLYPGHWQGTKEDYLRHYDCTVDAVCGVLGLAEIGPGNILNPAYEDRVNGAGQPAWGLDIVDHCAKGTNYWTGEQGTRICFLECSWYGQVGRAIDSLDLAIGKMRQRLGRYPHLADLPISIAEFAVLQDEQGHRLYNGEITEWGASWYAAVADRVYALNVQQVHEWAMATAGMLHPRTWVVAMLETMQGGQRLDVTVDATSAARAGVIACEKQGQYYLLAYNHRPWRSPAIAERMDLTLKLPETAGRCDWLAYRATIDRDHGVFVHELYRDCEQAGLAVLPDAPLYGGNPGLRFGPQWQVVLGQHRAKYAKLAEPPMFEEAGVISREDNALRWSFSLPGHAVCLWVITPDSPGAPPQRPQFLTRSEE